MDFLFAHGIYILVDLLTLVFKFFACVIKLFTGDLFLFCISDFVHMFFGRSKAGSFFIFIFFWSFCSIHNPILNIESID